MEGRIMKPCSWVMVFVLLFQWSGGPTFAAAQRDAEVREKQIEQAVTKLSQLFDALEEAAKEIPRDTFDPQAIVEKVGRDPIAIFEWVRDSTYLVPYRGTLRGPIGVLMDRLGNSLDRALLLHALLTLSGHAARLARGTLSKKQAEMVFNSARAIPPGGALPSEKESGESMDELVSKYAEKHGLDPDESQRGAQNLTLRREHMTEEIAQRVEDQTAAILALVGEPEVDIRAIERADAIDALRDHWWVQWKGQSGWVGLDSTSPDAKAGDTLVEVKATHQAGSIDKKLQHLVTIRVIIERWDDGKLEEERILEHTLRPSKLFGKPIVLRHVPLNWPEDLDLFAEEKLFERLRTVIQEEKEWLPVLTVGSEQIVQSSFTDLGEVNDDPGKKPVSPAEHFGDGARGPFGGFSGALSGGEPESAERKESYLTAEWIEYEINVPGKTRRKIRRKVFDLLGQTDRTKTNADKPQADVNEELQRGLEMLTERVFLPQVCKLSPQFVIHSKAKNLAASRDLLIGLSDRPQPTISKELFEQAGKLIPSSSADYGLALSRFIWSRLDRDVYIDRPNLFSFFKGISRRATGEIVVHSGVDIIDNEVRARIDSKEKLFSVLLEQGVLDTSMESMFIGEGEVVENTADLFAKSTAEGVKWLLIDNKRNDTLNSLNISKDFRTLIEHDLSEGYVVIVPQSPLSLDGKEVTAWWRIQPSSGNTLGISGWGGGQATVTYSVILKALVVPVIVTCAIDAQNDCEILKCFLLGGLAIWWIPFHVVAVTFAMIEEAVLLLIISLFHCYE